MAKYRVAQVGCGARGGVHLDGWLASPELFEVVAVCDLDEEKMRRAVEQRSLNVSTYDGADRMLAETKPDIFCFSTQPDVRLEMVELAAKHGVRGLVFEKPMATSLREARAMLNLCRENGIRAAVSHQHKYLTSFERAKAMVDSGGIGELERIDASCQAWLSQLGTHYVDYVLWMNNGGRAEWVVGHIHGRQGLYDSHPSPGYVMGQIAFENGVRSYVEFGKLSKPFLPPEVFWTNNRLTAYGSRGFAWCETDGRWGACCEATSGREVSEQGESWLVQERTRLQPLFAKDLATWLDDPADVHPCNIEITYHGYEIMEALCLSSLDHCRVDLPLDPEAISDTLERMRAELPDNPV